MSMIDYLYPIKKQQLDLKTYLMVKAAMTMLSSNNFKHYQVEFPEEERLHIKETAKKYQQQKLFLIFPSAHAMFKKLLEGISSQEVLIAVYHSHGPMNRGQHEFQGFLDADMVFHPSKEKLPLPVFHDETNQLLLAIEDVMLCMDRRGLNKTLWYQRLADGREMLIQRHDGMHILHNLGFFDPDTLWAVLTEGGVTEQEIAELREPLNRFLASLAMFVVNGMWYMKNDNG